MYYLKDYFEVIIQSMHIRTRQTRKRQAQLSTMIRVGQNIQVFLDQIQLEGIRNATDLHIFYLLIKTSYCGSLDALMLRLNNGIHNFLYLFVDNNLPHIGDEFSLRSHEEVLLILYEDLKNHRNDDDLLDEYLPTILNIMDTLYRQYNHIYTLSVQTIYNNCLSAVRELDSSRIRPEIHINQIYRFDNQIHQFFKVAKEYLQSDVERCEVVMRCLMEGLLSRMKIYSQKTHLTPADKLDIFEVYRFFTIFLQKNCNSQWPILALKSFGGLFDYLLQFASRNFNHTFMAQLINRLLLIYDHIKIANIDKFQFMLKIYITVISKASSMFTYIQTNFLIEHPQFLTWIVKTKLTVQKSSEIVEVFLSNRYALEFLLVVLIYYLAQHPLEYGEIAALLRVINFLQEVKYLLESEIILNYLGILFKLIHESDTYEDYISSVNERIHL